MQTMIETVVCCILYNLKVMMMKIIKYKGPYTNYVDKILKIFDPLPSVDEFTP